MADTEDAVQEQTQEAPKAEGIDYDKLASIIDGRIKTTEDSVLKGYLKEQGITGDEMAEAIKTFKESRKANSADSLQAQIKELQDALSATTAQVTAAKVEAAVVEEATKLGIDPKAIPYLKRMADLSDVGDKKGNISSEKVADALAKVLDDLPALKPQAQQAQGFRVGGTGDADGEAPKTDNAKLAAIFGVKG